MQSLGLKPLALSRSRRRAKPSRRARAASPYRPPPPQSRSGRPKRLSLPRMRPATVAAPAPKRASVSNNNNDELPPPAQRPATTASPAGAGAAAGHWSSDVLAEKQVLLPYLDQLEYVRLELQKRGVETHTEGRATAAMLAREAEASAETEGGAGGAKGVMAAWATPSATLPESDSDSDEDEDEHGSDVARALFFAGAAEPELLSAAPMDDDYSDDGRPTTRELSASYRTPYPRFCEHVDFHGVRPVERPNAWLLMVIEGLYDDLHKENMNPRGAARRSGAMEHPPELQLPFELDVGGAGAAEAQEGFGASSVVKEPPAVQLPHFVFLYLSKTYGVPKLLHQACVDLLFNLERLRGDFPSVQLFVNFLREVYDEDRLFFFLHVRATLQRAYGLRLAMKELTVDSTVGQRIKLPDNAVLLEPRPALGAGARRALLSEWAVVNLFRLVLGSERLGRYWLTTEPAQAALETRKVRRVLADKSVVHDRVRVIESQNLLRLFLAELMEVPDDVLNEMRSGDDGGQLDLLQQLQVAVSSDALKQELADELALQSEQLTKLDVAALKLRRKMAAPGNEGAFSLRTELFLAESEAAMVRTAIRDTRRKLRDTEQHQDRLWNDVMEPTALQKAAAKKQKQQAPKLARLVSCLERHLRVRRHRYLRHIRHVNAMADVWRSRLGDLQLKAVLRIQRGFRAARAREAARLLVADEVAERRQAAAARSADERRAAAAQQAYLSRQLGWAAGKRAREAEAHAALEARRAAILGRHQEQQAARQRRQHQLRALAAVLAGWRHFVSVERKRRAAIHNGTKARFDAWRGFVGRRRRAHAAAARLQARLARGVQTRAWAAPLLKRHRYCLLCVAQTRRRARHRLVMRTFGAWGARVSMQRQVRLLGQRVRANDVGHRFQRWRAFLRVWRDEKRASATALQRVWRGVAGRRVAGDARRRRAAATLIQSAARGRRGRLRGGLRRQQMRGVERAMRRVHLRVEAAAFAGWAAEARRLGAARRMAQRHWGRTAEGLFRAWRAGARAQKRERLQRREDAATAIQRCWRGFLARATFDGRRVRHRAAVRIQRLWRGGQSRSRAWFLRWQRDAAVAIQAAWRGFQARRRAHGIRVERVLSAADAGDYDTLYAYFESEQAFVVDSAGRNALHRGAQAGHMPIVVLCLEYGMDINSVTDHGASVLAAAVASKADSRFPITDHLLNSGVFVKQADDQGRTPLLEAAQLGHADVLLLLLQHRGGVDHRDHAGRSALHLAVAGDHTGAAATLLQHKADANAVDDEGCLPMHDAAAGGFVDMVRMLLRFGSRLDDADRQGFTPLMLAVSQGHHDAAALLLLEGVDVDASDAFGRTALHLAAERADAHACMMLLSSDATANVVDENDESPLHAAADVGGEEAVRLLLKFGADPNLVNTSGNQPIHLACARGSVPMVRDLVNYNADVNHKNFEYLTPVGLARMFNHKPVADFFAAEFREKGDGEGDEEWAEAVADSRPAALALGGWERFKDARYGHWFYRSERTGDCQWAEPPIFGATFSERAWGQHWSTDAGRWVFRNAATSETRWEPPGPDVALLQRLVQQEARLVRRPVKRVQQETVNSSDYIEFWTEETRAVQNLSAEHRAAIKVQRNVRRHQAQRLRLRMAREERAAAMLQRAWRGHRAVATVQTLRAQIRAARVIQRNFRGYLGRCVYYHFYNDMWMRRHRRFCAAEVQRVYRGHRARARVRKLRYMRPLSFDEWAALRAQSRQLREWGAFVELLAPQSVDVKFYAQTLTGVCDWWQPAEWAAHDAVESRERAELATLGFTLAQQASAVKLQTAYRGARERARFNMMLKGIHIMKTCEAKYLANPQQVTAICNYMLYLHAVEHEYGKARPLYARAMALMDINGKDNQFLLFSMAVFGAVTGDLSVDEAYVMAERARAVDPSLRRYQLAMDGFFRYAAFLKPHDWNALFNYATVRFLVFKETAEPTEFFIRALDENPGDVGVIEVFNFMQQQSGSEDDAYDVYRRRQRERAAVADGKAADRYRAAQERRRRNLAATVIQSLFRGHVGREVVRAMRWLANRDDWTKVLTDDGLSYYLHVPTGVSQWAAPTPTHPKPGQADDAAALRLRRPVVQPPWEEVWDEEGRQFYHNLDTGEVQWEVPVPAGGAAAAAEMVLPVEWERCVDDEGRAYYYHTTTGTSQWERPELVPALPPGWEECFDENSGATYFREVATGETSWVRP